jgi:predicted RNA-binding protein with PIN domain
MDFNNIIDLNTPINTIEYEKDFKNKYNYNKKMELVKKINKIKKIDYLINIFKIISLHSKNYNINNNGIFVFFHDLSDTAYDAIDKYVNSIYKLHKKSSNIINIYNSDYTDDPIIQSILSDTIEFKNEKELSNKEKIIMRRKKYEQYLDQNQEN